MSDGIAFLKDKARQTWGEGDFEAIAARGSYSAAADLVRFAGVQAGQKVLDVATGTGAVAITAGVLGVEASALDLSPVLLTKAQRNADAAGVTIEWREGDAEALPYPDDHFDVVLSQFGHMFAPQPDVVAGELLRVLRPGGRLAFSTWPPDFYVGRMFALNAAFVPPPPGTNSPLVWGTPAGVRERLGSGVVDIQFAMSCMWMPALSPAHYCVFFERNFGPTIRHVEALSTTPDKLEAWRTAYEALIAEYFERNAVRQDFLMTRAAKALGRTSDRGNP